MGSEKRRPVVVAAREEAWKAAQLWEGNKAGPGIGEKALDDAFSALIELGMRLGLEAAAVEGDRIAESFGGGEQSVGAYTVSASIRAINPASILLE